MKFQLPKQYMVYFFAWGLVLWISEVLDYLTGGYLGDLFMVWGICLFLFGIPLAILTLASYLKHREMRPKEEYEELPQE